MPAGSTTIIRRRMGRYELFERRPKPAGIKKYFVSWPDGLLEFGKYSKAIRWMKDRRNKERPCQESTSKPAAR